MMRMKKPHVIVCALQEEGRYRTKEFVLNPRNSGEALVILEQRCDNCSQGIFIHSCKATLGVRNGKSTGWWALGKPDCMLLGY